MKNTLAGRSGGISRIGGFLVSALIVLCPEAGARGSPEGTKDPFPESFKSPFSGVYEVRGEGFVHNAGDLWVNVTNLGVIGNPWKSLSTDPSCQYPPGSGVEYMWGAGIWVGAMIGENKEPHVSTALLDWEFRPSTRPLDTVYESYEGFPGGKRFFNDDGDTDPSGEELVDEEIHDGRDNDGDGLIDEDFAAISQQMFTCVYRDDSPAALNSYPEHVPLGLEITQKSFAWGIPGSDNFVGIEFTVKNDGRHDLRNVYLGFFCDPDVGPESDEFYWGDDRAGLVQDWSVGYVGYAHDNDGDGGLAEGWFGTMLLGHTIDPKGKRAPPKVDLTSFRFVSGGAAYENCGDPRNDFQRYDLLSSNMIGCPPGRLSADEDADYRLFFGTGPFRLLEVGGEIQIQVAFLVGEGRQDLIRTAAAARDIFDGEYMDLDDDPLTGINGKETCLVREPGEERWKFDYVAHCNLDPILYEQREFRPVLISEPDCALNPKQWVDFDCNPGTGIGGRESWVHWRGATAPPCPQVENEFPPDEEYPCHRLSFNEETGVSAREPIREPAVQLLPRDETVEIRWNNVSELVPDPLSEKYDFAGYRIWKAEQWERPVGSTGPTPDLWILLAEYRLPRYIEPRTGHIDLAVARDEAVTVPCDTVDASRGLYLYPVGYYRHIDERVLNGFTYFYSVTAFDMDETDEVDPRTGRREEFSIECRHVAVSSQAIVPGTDPVEGIGEVFVVPNPYYGNAHWDLSPNPRDPTGTQMDFMNLPKGPWTINIYTLSGDLVRTLKNDGGLDVGQTRWDLVSRNGQDITTGVYLYTVESRYGSQVGKFLVLKEQTYSR